MLGPGLVAVAFNVIGVIILFLLLTLSQEFVKTGVPVSSDFKPLVNYCERGSIWSIMEQ